MASPRKYLVILKQEATQFTDAAPVATANAMLVRDLTVTPLKVESEERALARGYLGNSEMLPVMEEANIEFSIEVAGAGAAGSAPKWAPALKACGFAETITAATSAAYNPISSGFTSTTIWCYRDGNVYKMVGCIGTVAFEFSAKKLPLMKFRFIGKYVPVSAASIPTNADFSGFQQPKASLPVWTPVCTVGGYAAKVAAITLDMSNELSHAMWMNSESIALTDRKPKGSITVEATDVTTHDYFADVRSATLQAFSVQHGTVAGNIVTVDAPKMQLVDISEQDYNATLAYQFNTTFSPNTGNDEVIVTVK